MFIVQLLKGRGGVPYIFILFSMNFNQNFKHFKHQSARAGLPFDQASLSPFFIFFLFPLGNFLLIGSSIVSGSVSLSVTADERTSAVHTVATGTGRPF